MKQLPFIIGLTGPAGSGKDTVADLLCAHHGYTKMAFADALRAEVCEAFRIDLRMLTERETKEHPLSALAIGRCDDQAFIDRMGYVLSQQTGKPGGLWEPRSPRQIMQWWGTEYRRAQRDGYWRELLGDAIYEHDYSHLRSDSARVVVTDVRFADEADSLRGHAKNLDQSEAQIWQITRPGHEVAPGAHASETTGAAFAPDRVIDNSFDMGHLEQRVLEALGGVTA